MLCCVHGMGDSVAEVGRGGMPANATGPSSPWANIPYTRAYGSSWTTCDDSTFSAPYWLTPRVKHGNSSTTFDGAQPVGTAESSDWMAGPAS
jgi:hypothetical protein